MKVIEKIKALSAQKDMSISELLRRAKLSYQVFDTWKYNVSPSIPALIQICEVLEVPIDVLFRDDEPSFTDSQTKLLNEWNNLTPIEKVGLKKYIKAMLYIDGLKK